MCLGKHEHESGKYMDIISYEFTANRDTAVYIWSGYVLIGTVSIAIQIRQTAIKTITVLILSLVSCYVSKAKLQSDLQQKTDNPL